MIFSDLSGTLGTVGVGDITEVLINRSFFAGRILAVDIFTLVLQGICGGILNIVVVDKGVDIGFGTYRIAVFYVNVTLGCADRLRGQRVDITQELFTQRGDKAQTAGRFLRIVFIIHLRIADLYACQTEAAVAADDIGILVSLCDRSYLDPLSVEMVVGISCGISIVFEVLRGIRSAVGRITFGIIVIMIPSGKDIFVASPFGNIVEMGNLAVGQIQRLINAEDLLDLVSVAAGLVLMEDDLIRRLIDHLDIVDRLIVYIDDTLNIDGERDILSELVAAVLGNGEFTKDIFTRSDIKVADLG